MPVRLRSLARSLARSMDATDGGAAAAKTQRERGDLERRIDFNVKLLPEVEKGDFGGRGMFSHRKRGVRVM